MEPAPGAGVELALLQITQEGASIRKRKKVSVKSNANCTDDSSSRVQVLLSKGALSGKKVASASMWWHLPRPFLAAFQLHMSFHLRYRGVFWSHSFLCLASN